MLSKLKELIQSENLIKQGDKVLVALSGGADSVCLLLNLIELSDEINLSLHALHVNHKLREESDLDQNFCSKLCTKYSIPLTIKTVDVKNYSEIHKKSIEESARDLRYTAFENVRCGGLVATAHSLSDNTETVLFNLVRGSGLKGLCGIPIKREHIIRPLLSSTRTEIEVYLKEKSQDFVIDKTNLTTDYTRNKLRLKVVPELIEINSNLFSTIGRTVNILKLENDYLEIETLNAYNACQSPPKSGILDVEKLLNLHTAIRLRCLTMLLRNDIQFNTTPTVQNNIVKNNGITASYSRIIELENVLLNQLQKPKVKINLAKNVYFIMEKGKICIRSIISKPILHRT